MTYTFSISISLGSSKSGLILNAQLFDTSGSDIGSLVSSGFVELGQGNYLWTYSGFPDDFRGGVKFYNSVVPGIILAATSINPQDIEYINKIKQEVETIQGQISATPKEITIEVPHIVASGSSFEISSGSSNPSKNIEIKTGVR